MANRLILVNGLPGAGKSTLAARLARELGCPWLSKDRIKEALADVVAWPGLEPSLGAVATEALWALAARVPGLVVAESWWFAPRDRDFLARGLATAGARSSVEVWCDVSARIARGRYEQRRRHPVHRDDRDMTAEWRRWAEDGEPVALGPVVRVDTSGPVDTARLAEQLRAMLV
ncbi:AAA family ATPase [Labedaea rhizosphaerae]|uniref:Putative kinase n=1 Tax=Labedaea rhizosphaerae TaxID=598644 RepID=A0A4R6S7I7_LABRH|nr:AAA family ATPase [Labedaea rhizosphaerae]TDP94786.1 putative kinase [Labedaea rhizosphaerae]